jgi:transposase
MIDQDKRRAIYLLHQEGAGIKSISRQLRVSRKTVKAIIALKGEMPQGVRSDKIDVDEALLRRLYQECDGFVQRVHEKLTGEEGVTLGYSTLTRLLRDLEISEAKQGRCEQVPDIAGAEMQHDTSPYSLEIGGRRLKVVASIVYFRYSKVRYLRFYRYFRRFTMKCFLHEALTFFDYSAPVCIIDNTNLARLRGTGRDAVIVPEMERFARQYNFEFICHKIGHHNRKAGNERSFYTVETNFFPGRKFASITDLNKQARDWATNILARRPLSKIGAIPSQLFEYEKSFLKKLPSFVSPPYLIHQRIIDQYGYASFAGNFYWVPGTKRHEVTLLQYADHLRIYHRRTLMAEYDLAIDGVKNEKILPKDGQKPRRQPANRKRPTGGQEKTLREVSVEVSAYLDFIGREKGFNRHRVIRRLHGLYRKMAGDLFVKAVARAFKYRIADIDTIERIAVLLMKEGSYASPMVNIAHDFEERQAFLDGCDGNDVDLSVYDRLLEDENG